MTTPAARDERDLARDPAPVPPALPQGGAAAIVDAHDERVRLAGTQAGRAQLERRVRVAVDAELATVEPDARDPAHLLEAHPPSRRRARPVDR